MIIQDAQVHLAGYVATEPKFRKTMSGTSAARLRVAYTVRRHNKETGEWADGATTFVNVQCWRGLADNVAMCLRKGEPVLVVGRLNIRKFEDAEGAQRTAVEVEASSVGHDLARGVAHFSRTHRSGSPPLAVAVNGQAADEQAPGDVAGQGEEHPISVPDGDSIIDERAVAEFAREITETLGADAPMHGTSDTDENAAPDHEADEPVAAGT